MDKMMPESHSQLSETRTFRVGDYCVEPSMLRIINDGQDVRLEPRTMQLLVYLAEHAGEVVSRTKLEEEIWDGRIVGEDALTNSISKLRRAFNDNARNPSVIETLPKTGYRLIDNVEWVESEPTRPRVTSTASARRHSMPGRLWAPLLLILLAGVVIWWTVIRQPGLDPESSIQNDVPYAKPSLAILPFQNLGETPQQDYFANGITTNLITDLSRVSALRVIASGSVFSYKDASGTKTISRELNVDYVVRGSVQRQGNRVRVNTQLIEAASERALWAERYDTDMNDMFKLQDMIAIALVEALNVELSSAELDIFSNFPTASGEAYDLFLRGMEEYGHRTPESNRSAQGYFEQAVELDPQFARAIAGQALVHSRYAIDGWTATPNRSLDRAAHFAESAAEINYSIPQLHFVAGQVALFRGEHAQAVEALQRAIDFSPNYADAYGLLAWVLTYDGRLDEAETALKTASRLNPVIPSSYSEILGEIRFLQGRYDDAITAFERALRINPTHMRARMWLIATLVQTGSQDEAQWQADVLTLSIPGFSLARLQYAFPFRDQTVREKVLQSLRQAGLPE